MPWILPELHCIRRHKGREEGKIFRSFKKLILSSVSHRMSSKSTHDFLRYLDYKNTHMHAYTHTHALLHYLVKGNNIYLCWTRLAIAVRSRVSIRITKNFGLGRGRRRHQVRVPCKIWLPFLSTDRRPQNLGTLWTEDPLGMRRVWPQNTPLPRPIRITMPNFVALGQTVGA